MQRRRDTILLVNGLPRRYPALVLGLLLVASGCAPTSSPSLSPPTSINSHASSGGATPAITTALPTAAPSVEPTAAPIRAGGPAWVTVSVATGWRSPASPRDVDAPALASPPRIREWLARLTPDLQGGLIGRVDTQVLLGERVLVTAISGAWAAVVVPEQPTPLDPRGYPCWIPLAQLSAEPPAGSPSGLAATVVTSTGWLEQADGARMEEISFGTELPVLSHGTRVQVSLPGGRTAWMARTTVVLHAPGSPALPASAASIARSAEQFLGLRYLWGGTSGFGFDCSGLVYLVYRAHGVTLPRDASPQSSVGRLTSLASAEPADLLFFERDGAVHHVAIWLGNGELLEAPDIDLPVRVEELRSLPYADELSTIRRPLASS